MARTPRETWITEGLRTLAAGGPDAVRVEPIAKALGVTKGGFYWHFDHREALLGEMLDAWERVMVDDAITAADAEGGDARARLSRLFALRLGGDLLRTELAVRDWARRDPAVAARLTRVDNRRVSYLRSLFAEFCADEEDVEARCLLVMALFVGTHFVAADHGPRPRADVIAAALRRLLD